MAVMLVHIAFLITFLGAGRVVSEGSLLHQQLQLEHTAPDRVRLGSHCGGLKPLVTCHTREFSRRM